MTSLNEEFFLQVYKASVGGEYAPSVLHTPPQPVPDNRKPYSPGTRESTSGTDESPQDVQNVIQ